MTPPRATPLATPIDLRRQRNASDARARLAAPPGLSRRDPAPAGGAARSSAACRSDSPARHRAPLAPARPRGRRRPARGGPGQSRRRRPFLRRLAGPGRGTSGGPADRLGHARRPAAGPLHRRAGVGRAIDGVMRRRFEVNEGIIGWGQGAFAAVAHTVDTPLDWRGPYPAMPGGWLRRARARRPARDPAGQLGSRPDRGGRIRCPARPATSRCGSTRSRSRTAPGTSPDCGWSRSRRSTRVAGSSSPRSRPSAGRPRRWSSSRGERSGSRASRGQPGDVGVDLGQVFRKRPAPPPLKADGRAVGRGHRLGDAARGRRASDGDARRPRDDRRRHDRHRRGSRSGGPPAGATARASGSAP